jgi:regulatory protein
MMGCRDTALRLLARREHSRVELDRKLFVKGFEESEIKEILDQLESEGLLSDARFAEAYVRARRQRGFGPLRIAMELAQRGIAKAMIDDHLHARSEDWFDLASSELTKRYGKRRAHSAKERARQARFLQGRGFVSEIIFRVLDEMS